MEESPEFLEVFRCQMATDLFEINRGMRRECRGEVSRMVSRRITQAGF